MSFLVLDGIQKRFAGGTVAVVDAYHYANAEKAFQKYIELIPKDPNPYDSYAELLLKMGRFEDSIAQYRKALEIHGVQASQLEPVSWGSERPKAQGHDETAWAQNRRADLTYPKQ